MKKISIFVIGLMLLSTMVLAQGMEREMVQSKVSGLENAMLRVQNETQAYHLEQVMLKIQEKRFLQLQKLEGLVIEEIDDEIIAEGDAEAKLFGLFKAKHTYKYQIQDDGSMERINRWNDIFYDDPVELEE